MVQQPWRKTAKWLGSFQANYESSLAVENNVSYAGSEIFGRFVFSGSEEARR